MTIKESLKSIIREGVDGRSLQTVARAGVVVENLGNGSASVMIDGRIHIVPAPYGAVKGMQVAVLPDTRGNFGSAVPFQPLADPTQFQQSPFFTGGLIRFVVLENLTGEVNHTLRLQDLGKRKVFRLDTGIPKGSGSTVTTMDQPFFSPDGTKVGAVFTDLGVVQVPASDFGSVKILIWKIGKVLKSAGAIDEDEEIFSLDAELETTISFPNITNETGVSLAGPFPWINIRSARQVIFDGDDIWWSGSVSQRFSSIGNPIYTRRAIYKLEGSAQVEKFFLPEFFSIDTGAGNVVIDLRFPLNTVGPSHSLFFGAPFDPPSGRRGAGLLDDPSFDSRIAQTLAQATDPPSAPIAFPFPNVTLAGPEEDFVFDTLFGSLIQNNKSKVLALPIFFSFVGPTPPNLIKVFRGERGSPNIDILTVAGDTHELWFRPNGIPAFFFQFFILFTGEGKGFVIDNNRHVRKFTVDEDLQEIQVDSDTDSLIVSPGETDPKAIRPFPGDTRFLAISDGGI